MWLTTETELGSTIFLYWSSTFLLDKMELGSTFPSILLDQRSTSPITMNWKKVELTHISTSTYTNENRKRVMEKSGFFTSVRSKRYMTD